MITDLVLPEGMNLAALGAKLWGEQHSLDLTAGWEALGHYLINGLSLDGQTYQLQVIIIKGALLVQVWLPGQIVSSHLFYQSDLNLIDCLVDRRRPNDGRSSLLSTNQVMAVLSLL